MRHFERLPYEHDLQSHDPHLHQQRKRHYLHADYLRGAAGDLWRHR
jgi:hypothetical protein